MEGGLGGLESNVSVLGLFLEIGSRDIMVIGKGAALDVEIIREDVWEVGVCVEVGVSVRV